MPYMQCLCLGFCAGALSFAIPWPTPWPLAHPQLLLAVGGCVAATVPLLWRWGRQRPALAVSGLLCAVAWSGWAHSEAFASRLDHVAAGGDVTLRVRLVATPERLAGSTPDVSGARFEALVLDGPVLGERPTRGIRVRLTWYDAPPLARGEVWTLQAALKGPWGYANPGGFDYERWLLGADLQATGWVREGTRSAVATPDAIERLRSAMAAALEAAELRHPGVLLALLTGRSDGIGDATWQVLRATGTVHLMVISGLHVSLATALGFALGRWLSRLWPPLLLWLDVRRAGCAVGAVVAVAYVAVAGAGLPALRALLMSATVLWLLAGGRTAQPAGVLGLALTVLLLLEPLAVHQQGFWLSFGAVAMLLLVLGRRYEAGTPRASTLRGLLRAQCALSVGMLPLLALTTGALPWLGIPANLVAVPMMSLCVIPAALLGGLLAPLLPTVALLPLLLADRALAAVLAWLGWLGQTPAPLSPASGATLLAAQAAAMLLVCGAPRRHWLLLAGCAALPLVPVATSLAPGAYRVMALDVGQGSAIAVDTRRHRLLYDTGPGFPSGFETGSAVVVPSLAVTGPQRLDALILSHDDMDHVGGYAAVRQRLAPGQIWSSYPLPGARRCAASGWRWDGVQFRWLDLQRPPAAADNDLSCVLLVDDGRHATLIAGDVSARVEAGVLRQLAERAPLTLMFAPHHGSNSSSSRALLRVLRPTIVFVSAARGNRFGHPHPAVRRRYAAVGARMHQTGLHGALIWSSTAPQRVLRWREHGAPYWRAGLPALAPSSR